MNRLRFRQQLDSQDCGLACVEMIGRYYHKDYNPETFESYEILSKQGITISELEEYARNRGFNTQICHTEVGLLETSLPLPAIILWEEHHFVVVYKINNMRYHVADPAYGKVSYTESEFDAGCAAITGKILVLLLEPGESFPAFTQEKRSNKIKPTFDFDLKGARIALWTFISTLLLSSILGIILPFFSRAVIDKGIYQRDIPFVWILLLGQMTTYTVRLIVNFFRSWVANILTNRLILRNVSVFLRKMFQQSLTFFSSRRSGDIIQRVEDSTQIIRFYSIEIAQFVFAILSTCVYLCIILYFSLPVFLISILFIAAELIWIVFFWEKIKSNEYKRVSLVTEERNNLLEFIHNIQDIKLNNLENFCVEKWAEVQEKLCANTLEKLRINQKYECYTLLEQMLSVTTTAFCALSVIQNEMTLGTLFAIAFILGAVNTPISTIINLILKYKIVSVSAERIQGVLSSPLEKRRSDHEYKDLIGDIVVSDACFSYSKNKAILDGVNAVIPSGKTTAIVGASGCGKTTLMKILLKFYRRNKGDITVNGVDLDLIEHTQWRDLCGAVLQDSKLFSESIAFNVGLTKKVDKELLRKVSMLVNMDEFIRHLPMGYNTVIGDLGLSLSQGQKQRILIARALYKNPEYIFFDEATNSLDAINEEFIVRNIYDYFHGKTLVVVAHRLSTIRRADQIIVLDQGRIIESGSHDTLMMRRGAYYNLVCRQ